MKNDRIQTEKIGFKRMNYYMGLQNQMRKFFCLFRQCLLVSLFLTCLLLPVREALASPYDHFGLSSRAAAMGGAYTALATNYTGNYYNPAALVFSPGASVGLGATFSSYYLYANDEKRKIDPFYGMTISGVLPFKGMFENRTALGMLIFLAEGSKLYDMTSLPQGTEKFIIEEDRPAHIQILANLSVRLAPGLSIGGGLQVNQYLWSKINVAVDSNNLLGTPNAPVPLGDIDIINVYKGYPMYSLYYQPMDKLRFGLTYREDMNFRLKLVSTVNIQGAKDLLGTVSNQIPVELTVDCHILYTPRQATLGVAYQPLSPLTASFDLAWMDWSNFPSPAPNISVYSPVPEVNQAFQNSNPPLVSPRKPGFHDTLVTRVGAEYKLFDWFSLRAGYMFTPSPVPKQTDGTTNYLDSSRHTITFGTGFRFLDPIGISVSPVEVGLHFQYHHFAQRKVTRDFTTKGSMLNTGLDVAFTF